MNSGNNISDTTSKYSEIFSSTSKYSSLRIILFAVSYVFYILITRLLGPQEFGKLALLIQLGTEIGTVLVIGLPMALTRFIPEMKLKKDRSILFSKSLNVSLIIFLGFSIIYFTVTYFFRNYIPEEIIQAKYFLFAFILIIGMVKLGIGMLSGLGSFISGTVFDGSTHIIWRLISFLILIFFTYRQFRLIFSVNVIVHFVVMVIIFLVLRNYFVLSGFKIDSKIIKFSITVMASQIIFALIAVMDPLLIRIMLDSSSEVGFYYAGTRIPLLFQTLFFAPLAIPFLYYFSRPDSTFKIKETIVKFGTKMLTIIFAVISLLVYSFADKFILLFFGREYSNSIIVLQIFSFTLFFIALEVFSTPYFLSVKKPFIPLILGAVYLVLVITLNFIFIPIFKSAGPAISALCGLGVRITMYLVLLKKQKINFIKTYLILSGILAASVVIDIFILSYTGVFIFIVLVFLTRMITVNDIKRMFSIIRKRKVKNI